MLTPPIEPMLAKLTADIPDGDGWLYEPKWDGFRCARLLRWPRRLPPEPRPEAAGPLLPRARRGARRTSLPRADGARWRNRDHRPTTASTSTRCSMRIHPAASRVRKLAARDAVVVRRLRPARRRRRRPARRAASRSAAPASKRRSPASPAPAYLTPATRDARRARDWFERFEGAGLDGVVAKRLDDIVPARRARDAEDQAPAHGRLRCRRLSLEQGRGGQVASARCCSASTTTTASSSYVGHTSSFKAQRSASSSRRSRRIITDDERDGLRRGPHARRRRAAGPATATSSWVRLRPELVCEVTFDYLQGERFRHAATFQRWRTDKPPRECTFDQITATRARTSSGKSSASNRC